jgi:hypothetical protein
VIGFLHPWVLIGLPLAAVPLILHLVQRRDPPTVEFPAVRYLVQVTEEHQRRLRLRHWLLLLVRTVLILALIVAAAGPSAPLREAASHSPSALVLIVDDSPSSGAVLAGSPRLSELRAAARRILEKATPSDVLWLLTSDLVARRGAPVELLRIVDSLSPSMKRLDLGRAVSLAGEVLATDPRPGGIVVLSDMQATALSPATTSVPVVVGRSAEPPPLNVGLTRLEMGAQPWTPEGGTVIVTAGGDSGAAAPVAVSLGDRPGRQALVPTGGSNSFALAGAIPGWWTIRASKSPDELRVDDDRVGLVRVAPIARGVWDPADRYVGAAAEVLVGSGRLGRGTELSLGELGPGASVVIPPADPALLGALNRSLERRGAGWRFGALAVTPTVSDSGPLLGRVQVLRRYRLESLRSGVTTGVIATAGGGPWIVRSGNLVLLGSRLDPAWTTLPLSASFMPFMDALVNRLARGPITLLEGTPGEPVLLPDAVSEVTRTDQRWRVEGGGGFTPPLPGIYYLLTGRDTVGGISVNVDARESALAQARDATIEGLWRGARVTRLANAGGAAFAGAGRASLQDALLWLALALMLAEVALASGHRRSA